MEKLSFDYSTKNIPIASERSYKLKLMEKTEMVIKRMRWKALFSNDSQEKPKENYGLKTFNCPKKVPEMMAFENDLINVVRNVEFRMNRTNNTFQRKLSQDIRKIATSTKTLTAADKTSNMYRLTKEQHDKLLHNAITTTYKKENNDIKHEIDKGGKKIAKKAGALNKMEINGTSNCFITLKDHKDNFSNKPTVRLINPAKNEIGRISKRILDEINSKLRTSLGVNQWKNTTEVIDWFKQIHNKKQYKFAMFDIKDFYPSITEQLLKKALNFAARRVGMKKEDKEIIFHARKSLLFNRKQAWSKKAGNTFDVTMGAYDGAEVCELIGLYILHQLSSKYNKKDIGLYRDDGLSVFKNISGPQAERIKKDFQKVFKRNGLNIVIECNKKIVDYLDVTFNLNDGTYRPYRKPNNDTMYIHKESNHPPNVIKHLPNAIEKRLSELSSSKEIFDNAKGYYEVALKKSGFETKLNYTPPQLDKQNTRRNRKRNIIWFNPPYSKNVKTKVAEKFLKLIKRHFPQRHKFHKLFNKNNVKVSYSSMPNVKSIINTHNRKVLSEKPSENVTKCDCRNAEHCPLDGSCLVTESLYEATISSNLPRYESKIYKGISEPQFKVRVKNHEKSFNHNRYKNDTTLSTEYWRIKGLNGEPKVTWRVLRKCRGYNPETKRCMLCISEKLEIAEHERNDLLNQRSEIVTKCRHQNKFALANIDTKRPDTKD